MSITNDKHPPTGLPVHDLPLPLSPEASPTYSSRMRQTPKAAVGSQQKRGGRFPKPVIECLNKWLSTHTDHPYPTEDEKKRLCSETGLSMSQISNWMAKARRLILAPTAKVKAAIASATVVSCSTAATLHYEKVPPFILNNFINGHYPLTNNLFPPPVHGGIGFYPPTTSNSTSYFPRKRRGSGSSAGSCGTAESGNSDPKALCEDLPDFFLTSQVEKYWEMGASILYDLEVIEEGASRPLSIRISLLIKVLENFCSVANEVNLNAKVWSVIGTTLSRHIRDLKSYQDCPDIAAPIQKYIKVLKDTLILWIRTIDPSIHLPSDELPFHETRAAGYSQHRYDLFHLTKEYGTGPTDEDNIYEQNDRLEKAVKAMIGKISIRARLDSSGGSQPPKHHSEEHCTKDCPKEFDNSDLDNSLLHSEGQTSRKRMRSSSGSDYDALTSSRTSKRRRTATSVAADVPTIPDAKDTKMDDTSTSHLIDGLSPLHLPSLGYWVEAPTSGVILNMKEAS